MVSLLVGAHAHSAGLPLLSALCKAHTPPKTPSHSPTHILLAPTHSESPDRHSVFFNKKNISLLTYGERYRLTEEYTLFDWWLDALIQNSRADDIDDWKKIKFLQGDGGDGGGKEILKNDVVRFHSHTFIH